MADLIVHDGNTDIDDLYPLLPEYMCAMSATKDSDIRPRIMDITSGKSMLIDSGAMITVVPRKLYPSSSLDNALTLEAVDGSKIKTFGKVDISLNFSGKAYRHKAIVANIDDSILGWDFMRAKQLNFEWHDNVCYLVDNSLIQGTHNN